MLGIAVEDVCDLITHIRAFDIKIPADYSRESDATTEVSALEAVEDVGEEPVYDELASFIGALNEEEQINLVALTWLGRGGISVPTTGRPGLRPPRTHDPITPTPTCSEFLSSATISKRGSPRSAIRVRINTALH